MHPINVSQKLLAPLLAGLAFAGCAMINGIQGELNDEKTGGEQPIDNGTTGVVSGQVAVAPEVGFTGASTLTDQTNLQGVPNARVRAIAPDGSFIDVTTNAEGQFFIELPNGEYNLVAERVNPDNGEVYNAQAPVEVTNGEDQRLAEPLTIIQSGAIIGVVYLEGKAPGALTASVVAIREIGVFALTDEYGSFAFPNIPAGNYSIDALHLGYEAAAILDIAVETAAFTSLDPVSLATAASITPAGYGLVSGIVSAGGSAVAGALVSVKGLGTPAVSDNEGAYTLALPAGNYTLFAVADGLSLGERTVDVVDQATASADFSLSQAPTAGQGQVSGRIIHGDSGAPLASVVVISNPSRGQSFSDNNGRFNIDLPVGCYSIAAARGGFEQSKTTVCLEADLALDIGDLALYPQGADTAQCVAVYETCNTRDDDCDGQVDEDEACD